MLGFPQEVGDIVPRLERVLDGDPAIGGPAVLLGLVVPPQQLTTPHAHYVLAIIHVPGVVAEEFHQQRTHGRLVAGRELLQHTEITLHNPHCQYLRAREHTPVPVWQTAKPGIRTCGVARQSKKQLTWGGT